MTFLTTTDVPVPSAPRRMRRGLLGLGWLAGAALAFAVPVAAQAGSGYLSVNLNLRAGPSIDYPVVRLAPRGTAVTVYGCIDDYGWCDVSWRGNRGWVSGQYLDYDYYDRRVPVIHYGPRLGLGLISFNFGGYWDRHYRHQSWYGQRNHYNRVVVRHAPRHHGYYATPHRTTTVINRHDRNDRYDRQHRYHRNDARRDYRRDVRNDIRHDRRDIRRDARNDVRHDRRDARNEVRHNRRDGRNEVRQDRRQATHNERHDRRQVSHNNQNGRNGRNTERQR